MLNDKKNFCVISLGCKVNRAEIDSYSEKLLSSNWNLTRINDANLIIVNTCTVTSVADKKTRQTVSKVCRECSDKNAKIIITGCAAAIDSDAYTKKDNRIVYLPKCDMDKYVDKLCDSKVEGPFSSKILNLEYFRTRAMLKIQDGCNNNCTYCIVCKARGKEWSLSRGRVKEILINMFNAGIKEVVLTGVNLGAYNDNNFYIEDLCEDLLDVLNKYASSRIRLSSIEPQNVSDRLIDIIAASNGLICRHLHLPLQSGSSKILKNMNRHYDADQYLSLVQNIRNKIPSISLSTDIIVGFPGETDDDFMESVLMAKKCGFMKIHVFPYSIRSGTIAAGMSNQINDEIKKQRASILRDLSDQLKNKDWNKRIGSSEYVLCETGKIGRTESYHQIQLSCDAQSGDLIKLVL